MHFLELSARTRNALVAVGVIDKKTAYAWLGKSKRGTGVYGFLRLKPIGKKSMDEIVMWLSSDYSTEDDGTVLRSISVSLRDIATLLMRMQT